MADDADEGIEVGATGDALRLWRAKEAVRMGEVRLAAQAQALTALEGRATQTTAWCSAGLLALTAVIFAGWTPSGLRAAAAAAALPLIVAVIVCQWVLLPRDWGTAGFDPLIILDDALETEVEALEASAQGYSAGVRANNARLRKHGVLLRIASAALVATPAMAAAAYAAFNAVSA